MSRPQHLLTVAALPIVALPIVALAFVTLALVTPSRGMAQAVESYTVREGDTCASIAERFYGSPRRYDRIHDHNPSLGAMPHHLHAGMVLELPLPRESGADATVTDARGSVRAQLPTDASWSGARIGEELASGARVSTGEQSSAELTFRSSSVAAIRAETLVIVHGGSVERIREEGSRAVLREGSLLSRLSSLSGGAPLVVETPSALVEVSEGETVVRATPNGTSVSTHSGRSARVRSTGASDAEAVEVPVGHGSHVRRGARPTPPRPLPTSPAWAAGEARSFLGVVGVGGTMTGSWLPADHAASYRVEIARREDGRDLVYQAEVPATVTRFEAHQFPPGSYYVRVSTLDTEAFEGRPAVPTTFEIVGVTLVAPGEALPAPGAGPADILEELDALAEAALFATSAPPPPEALLSTRVVVPDGVVCAEGTSEPSHELVLRAAGDTFLTCVSPAGTTIVGLDLRVVLLRARVLTDAGEALGPLSSEQPTNVHLVLEGGGVDPGALVLAAEGIDVGPPTLDGAGGLFATLTPSASAAGDIALTLAMRDAPDVIIGSAQVSIAAPEPVVEAPPPVEPTVASSFALHEGLGVFATPSWVGLRDEQRTGIGGTLGLTFASARLGEVDPRVRMVAGVTAGLEGDYLRLSAVAPLDIIGQATRSADRGARDLFVAVGSRVLSTEDGGGAGLALEVGMWAPTAGTQGLDRGRLSVAGDFSLRFLERLALRTRQAGIFDLVSNGSMLWASAYGFDVSIVGPLSVGLEGTMTIGREDGRDWYAGGVGLGVGLDLSPVVISIAGRYGFGDDLWPTATLAANVRASFDP